MVRPGLVTAILLWSGQVLTGGVYQGFSAPEITFPIETPGMQAAIGVIDRQLEYTPLRSIAIIGADDISRQWLTINEDYLRSLGAIGIVVNVESYEQLDILRQYSSIPLMVLPGHWAVEHYGPVYPLLIDARAGRLRQ
ncbi:MAG: integrating conjugative element protein [Pseudomonadota bacterium]